MGWLPDNLYFLATGNSPFTLAYGSTKLTIRQYNQEVFSYLIKDIKHDTVTLGESYTLAGEKVLTANKPYKQWILWSILVLGISLVIKMMASLIKQIKNR